MLGIILSMSHVLSLLILITMRKHHSLFSDVLTETLKKIKRVIEMH